MHKIKHRVITILLLFLLGFISVFCTQEFLGKQVLGKSTTIELICSRTPTLAPEELSKNGRISYDRGQFDEARDCWQRAAVAYYQLKNETETINNQINQAQAEQALGFSPKACNTLLQIHGYKDACTTLLENPQQLQEKKEQNSQEFPEEDKQKLQKKFFDSLFEKSVGSSTKLIGLRSFGNVLRGLGELDLSNYVLLQSLNNAQSQEEQSAILFDLGNTRRALSNKEQDLYSRSGNRQNIVCAIVNAYAATDAYQQAIKYSGSSPNSLSTLQLQADLNKLSFLLDLKDWHNEIDRKENVFIQLFSKNSNLLKIKVATCKERIQYTDSNEPLIQNIGGEIGNSGSSRIQSWLFGQLSNNPIIQSPYINRLQQQIEGLPLNHTTLYTRLNFAKTWMQFQSLSETQYQQIESFLNETIEQAGGKKDKKLRDIRAESYALGYLGKLYEDKKQWDLARKKTQKALLIAQSIPAPDIAYQWQWQLGRIYKPELGKNERVKAKEIQNDLKDIKEAREAYGGAFETLQSLRRELASGSPDAQLSFLEEIETVYREYVDVLLRDEEPEQVHLSQARTVIASLQAVELENFLRQACPENNVQEIDKVLEKEAKTTAFIYPIVLEDRIELILKLPNKDKELKRFRKMVKRDDVEKLVEQLQLDLEEEYTFEAVREEANQLYNWLMKDVDQYIDTNYKTIDNLVFALDTNLRNIPLAALVVNYDKASDKVEYLIDKYAIALAPRLDIPSPTLLLDKKLKILAAGLTEPSPEVQERRKFSKLRYVDDELKVIEALNKSNNRVSIIQLPNENFNTKKFQSEINTLAFQILHLATHGEFSSLPENTFILAYDNIVPIKQIGDIFRIQAQNQLEPIELLVLSACETAAGDRRATLGISGVGVRAGARSSLASLWTLDDKISVEFTQKFYDQLINKPKQKKARQTKAQALQQAQQELKASPGREHPRYWAPYILLGNWL
ncbi:CHAT domain-containing protein [Scytonema sp. UIC 10036]|uniref:CHAT domain-containing protein n=1 Tax=Scytonema sp. UIC 10036 TaxID=2304196 RepID=UPI0012DA910E|nr:CHAT domain-containing protein [Scytonema sp. UIC 10036]MUG97314.1 CHAT domain-containing protein [Scytonema sp. UIC 10036]